MQSKGRNTAENYIWLATNTWGMKTWALIQYKDAFLSV